MSDSQEALIERARKWALHGSITDDQLWALADSVSRTTFCRVLAPSHAIVGFLAGHRAATDEHRALREAVRALAWALTRERVKELCKQLAMPVEWEAAVVEVIDSEEES